ncbi:MAG TPA: FAD-dependent oxidoreductase [Acetobacteraceae bacterium]|nr:FAD-dependent oxidoreductase [Acetobacteraceae bacterium]
MTGPDRRHGQRILVLGAGFAGLWSAIAASRARQAFGIGPEHVEIMVLNRTAWHSIRVRNYERDLAGTVIPLASVLDPIGVTWIEGEATDVDPAARTVTYSAACRSHRLSYDRLVFALGSQLVRPPIPGLRELAFDVDTYESAVRLNRHVASLPSRPPSPGRRTVLVVGGGLTGIETATEMVAKLGAVFAQESGPPTRVILADRQDWIGSDMGEGARNVIAQALRALGVETRTGMSLAAIDADGATLADGERIEAATVVWCAGLQAHPLTARFPNTRDPLGRLAVDACLQVEGGAAEFAAGDAAWFAIDGTHATVMSCQHARPMGRFAGHNAICHLLGRPMLPLRIDWYATVLDLGDWGAVYTYGWDRRVVAQGMAAKRTKQVINCERIYPPRSGNAREILESGAPTVQPPPAQFQ